ncbi:hypothetical protein [Streptomyces sp. KL116D]|uniref:hypothetical protein n=1 Tax=Streptomyces sp. KL116D TaxID=3045152 RepID=UPI003555D3ED
MRQRIKKAKRPLPVYAFDQAPVLSAVDRALARRRRRISGIVAVAGVAAISAGLGAVEPWWALVAALVGVWALFLGDRVVAQQQLNAPCWRACSPGCRCGRRRRSAVFA